MTTYVLPVYSPCSTTEEQWRFALNCLGYRLKSYIILHPGRVYIEIPGKSLLGASLDDSDFILLIRTDAPKNVVEALWSMTGATTAFIALAKEEISTFDGILAAAADYGLELTR